MIAAFDQDRLASIKHLSKGFHAAGAPGKCVMEAVAFILHKENWNDHPPGVCPVIGNFMRTWNDDLPDVDRTALLLPFVPRLINTRRFIELEGRNTRRFIVELEDRRAMMALDWLIRTHIVAWLRLAKFDTQAAMIAALPEIADVVQLSSIMPPLKAAGDATAAAWAAVAAATTRAAAWAALEAGWQAAVEAGWGAAAGCAAVMPPAAEVARAAAIKQTRKQLQLSACALIDRMIALKDLDSSLPPTPALADACAVALAPAVAVAVAAAPANADADANANALAAANASANALAGVKV